MSRDTIIGGHHCKSCRDKYEKSPPLDFSGLGKLVTRKAARKRKKAGKETKTI